MFLPYRREKYCFTSNATGITSIVISCRWAVQREARTRGVQHQKQAPYALSNKERPPVGGISNATEGPYRRSVVQVEGP